MKGRYWQITFYLLFLALGIATTVAILSGQDLAGTWQQLQQTRWGYVLLSLLLTLLGHVVRALRWRQLLAAAGQRVHWQQALVALMNGYFVNLFVPRLGEVTRCGTLNRLSGTSVSTALGTVITERVVDLISLAFILVATFFSAQAALRQFYEGSIVAPLGDKLPAEPFPYLLAGAVLLFFLVAGILFLRSRPQMRVLAALRGQALALSEGLLSVLRLRHPGRFLLYTLLIWASYFSAPLLVLLALDLGTGQLAQVALVAFSVGSIARTIPAPAGSMGPYHWLVSQSLLLFGLSQTEGLAVATLNHAVQTLFYILVGGAAYLLWAWWAYRMPVEKNAPSEA